jgi:hypothetical protein
MLTEHRQVAVLGKARRAEAKGKLGLPFAPIEAVCHDVLGRLDML